MQRGAYTQLAGKYGWAATAGALTTAALALLLLTYRTPAIDLLTFTERVCGMNIKPFLNWEDSVYYITLPAYAGREQVSITKPRDVSINFSTGERDYGNTLARLPLQEPVTLTISAPNRREERYTVELLQSRNIPAIFVETGCGGAEHVRLDKGNKTRAAVTAVNPGGEVVYHGNATLTGRGNTTWIYDKRPYDLKFRRPATIINPCDSATTWCLLANYSDDSQMRNAICYHIAREVGVPYTSRVYFASLYINGDYQGLYNLIDKQSYMAGGGWDRAVFEETSEHRTHDAVSDHGFHIRTRHGNAETVVQSVNAFERTLYSGTAHYRQLSQYADLHSLARKCFVDMVCATLDINFSQYYTLDEAGRIAPICAWDYDLSLGNTWYYPDFCHNQIQTVHPWYNALCGYREFRGELAELLRRHSHLLREGIRAYEDSLCTEIESDWGANAIRWQGHTSFSYGDTHLKSEEHDLSTLHGQKDYIDAFTERRLSFLAEYWQDPGRFRKLEFAISGGSPIAVYCPQGDTLREEMLPAGILRMPDKGFMGWYTEDGKPLTEVDAVTQDMSFTERLSAGEHSAEEAMGEAILGDYVLSAALAAFASLGLWLIARAVIIPIKEARE